MNETYTAFTKDQLLANGSFPKVSEAAKSLLRKNKQASIFIFNDQNGKVVDLDLRELSEEPKTGPGRPKLGVLAREITLLPQHWDWLSIQTGGASITLRRLVDEASRNLSTKDQMRLSQDATYRFMHATSGDRENYEEALRALYAKDDNAFAKHIANWPKDIKKYLKKLSANSWQKSS